MKKTIYYKGFEVSYEYDRDAKIFHGELLNEKDVITFQAQFEHEVKQALTDSIDDYLAWKAKKEIKCLCDCKCSATLDKKN